MEPLLSPNNFTEGHLMKIEWWIDNVTSVGSPARAGPNNFTEGRLMKIEWLVTDVTAVWSHDRAERAILGVILARRYFGQFTLYLWSGSYFVM